MKQAPLTLDSGLKELEIPSTFDESYGGRKGSKYSLMTDVIRLQYIQCIYYSDIFREASESYRKQVNSKFSSDTEEKIMNEIVKNLGYEL